MRAAFLLTQSRGGPVDLTVSLASELSGRDGGPEVIVLGPPSIADTGLPRKLLRPVDVRSKLDGAGFAAVSKWLDELAPDIVHAQDHRAGLVSALAAGRIPVALTFHGIPDCAAGRWVTTGPLRGRAPGIAGTSRLVASALVARRVRHTVAPCHAMAAFLRRELRVPSSRIRLVHNGVAIPPHSGRPGPIRTFATAGSFSPCKATPLLIEAFAAVAADRAGLRLKMIGDGVDRRRCEELARSDHRRCQVEFTGHCFNVDAQLRQADAFVLPSLNENLPLALLQAMALGLPCIASDVGGIPEVLDPDCGLLVPPGDVLALRVAMNRLLHEPGLAARLGIAARRRVQERFSQSRCADGYLRLWSDMLRASRP